MKTFSNKIYMNFSQTIDTSMYMMYCQINRTIIYATSDRVIPEIQNIMGALSSVPSDSESNSSNNNNQDNSDASSGLKTKTTKKDSMFAFDLRDTEKQSFNMESQVTWWQSELFEDLFRSLVKMQPTMLEEKKIHCCLKGHCRLSRT